jgi:hypothetical protein
VRVRVRVREQKRRSRFCSLTLYTNAAAVIPNVERNPLFYSEIIVISSFV